MLGNGYGLTHGGNGPFFQPGNLGLRNAQIACYLHLGLAIVKSQGEDLLFPVIQ